MPKQTTRERIRRLYFDKGLDVRMIALQLGISTQAVYKHLKRLRAEEKEAS